MQKITPHLWFDDQAEEAAQFYTSVFKHSSMGKISRYGTEGTEITGKPAGSVMTVAFQLEGQDFIALNGGPVFTFSPAISFFVSCESQAEVDELWEKLSADPDSEQCGWLKDKFGVSWQIIPTILGELLNNADPAKSQRAMKAMLQMKKLDIQALQRAANEG